jgi:hypothetical protein
MQLTLRMLDYHLALWPLTCQQCGVLMRPEEGIPHLAFWKPVLVVWRDDDDDIKSSKGDQQKSRFQYYSHYTSTSCN